MTPDQKTTYMTSQGNESDRQADAVRIAEQSHTFNLQTEEFLKSLPLEVSGKLIDFGTGTGGAHPVLVNYAGHIIATDNEEDKLVRARAYAQIEGLNDKATFEYHLGGIASLELANESIDTVYGRLIWQHLDLPTRVKEMNAAVKALKPGGIFIAEDMNLFTWKLEPTTPTFDLFIGSLIKLFQMKGLETQMGPKLVDFCKNAGLEIVKVNTYKLPVSGNNPFKRIHIGIFQSLGSGFIKTGMMTEEEFKSNFAQLTSDILDESRTAHTPHITQVAARK